VANWSLALIVLRLPGSSQSLESKSRPKLNSSVVIPAFFAPAVLWRW